MASEHADPTLAPTQPSADPARVAMRRLEDQLDWYDERAGVQRRAFLSFKVVQIVVAAAIPVVAAAGASAALAGALGAVIVVVEGIQQLFQLQQNWVGYRGTAEELKREKYLYLAGAGPYATAPAPAALLAERVEGLVAREHAGWAVNQRTGAGRRQAARAAKETAAGPRTEAGFARCRNRVPPGTRRVSMPSLVRARRRVRDSVATAAP